jgi:hypothetical protein
MMMTTTLRHETSEPAHTFARGSVEAGWTRSTARDATLARCGLARDVFAARDVRVAEEATADLVGVAPPGTLARIWTADVATYRTWLRVSDPRAAIAGELAYDPAALAAPLHGAAAGALARIARAYLFADVAPVARFAPAIEHHFGPFEAVVVVLRRLTIAPGARLVIAGAPTILVADCVDVHDGADVTLTTICHAALGVLTRHGAPRQ